MRARILFMLATCCLLTLLPQTARASFHFWRIDQIFSNADGSIQYVDFVLVGDPDDERFLSGHTLTSGLHSMEFLTNLPSEPVLGQHFLVATDGFAAVAGITPDYTFTTSPSNDPVVPFFNRAGDTLNFAIGTDTFNFGALPSDGITALNKNGTTALNSPTNFAGQVGFVPEPASWVLCLFALSALGVTRRMWRRA